MAEIEHFCDPSDKTHEKFDSIKDIELTLYSACNQMDGQLPQKVKIADAVNSVKKPIYRKVASVFIDLLTRFFLSF